MMKRVCSIVILIGAAFILFSCATTGTEDAPQKEPPQETTAAEQKDPPKKQDEKPSEPSTQSSANEEPEQREEKAEQDYEMTAKEKEETKRDLNELVDKLNTIISRKNYEKWLDYLTDNYKEHYSDEERLKEISESPILQKHGIKLRSLRDYFTYVVVASRKDVHIDDIKAIGEDTVKAYMEVDEQSVVVYTLTKVEGQWKITISN
jgi:flagellar motor protein MotB